MQSEILLNQEQLDFLHTPLAIRERAKRIFERMQNGGGHFLYRPEKLDEVVQFTLDTIKKNYPDFVIPFHSRWGHFRAGDASRLARLDIRLSKLDLLERARAKIDLVVTSVLLDAGAGDSWTYLEPGTNKRYSRSEGLGVASLHWFLSGAFGPDCVLAENLRNVRASDIESAFQVGTDNPLVGVEGRRKLLIGLADALENKKLFRNARPGSLVDLLLERHGKQLQAHQVLTAVLDGLGSIWPGRLKANGLNLGDVWLHSGLGSGFSALVPFHKLSQWLTYSLLEPLLEAGFHIEDIDGLTGLAEYRNGGLLVDSGLIQVRDSNLLSMSHLPSSELVIEWRALTVYFLDQIADMVRAKMGRSALEFPLAKVLEGGTWWAGRELAKRARPLGGPPILIQSDGTVF